MWNWGWDKSFDVDTGSTQNPPSTPHYQLVLELLCYANKTQDLVYPISILVHGVTDNLHQKMCES